MTAPAVALQLWLQAVLIGAVLGAIYGFLAPLRVKATALADGLFLLAVFAGWLVLAFGICAGDIRPGYSAGLLLGGFLWEATAGRLLRPVFWGIWRLLFWPVKKYLEFSENFTNFCWQF